MWSVSSFKGRVFYWAENKQSFWYATAGAYRGRYGRVRPVSTQITRGGYLVQMVTWTLDSGSGIDDLAVFIFSTGETLVYQGSDPGDVNDWSLIGRFQIGDRSARAHMQDCRREIILTRDGYIDLSVALKDGATLKNRPIRQRSSARPGCPGPLWLVLRMGGSAVSGWANVPRERADWLGFVNPARARYIARRLVRVQRMERLHVLRVPQSPLLRRRNGRNVCLADAGTSDRDRILSWASRRSTR